MSVASPVVDSWDGEARLIYLKSGVTTFNWIDDIYKEYRYWRRTDESSRKWLPFMRASGNEPKGGGKFTPRYVTLLDGARVVPWDENVLITVTGEGITDNADVDPDPFNTSTRTQPVKLYITPPTSELVLVEVGGGTVSGTITEQDKLDIADRVWDESLSAHQLPNSAGLALSTASGIQAIDVGSIVDGVWDADLSQHQISGSTGEALAQAATASGITVSGSITEQDKLDIADRVWDELLADHTIDGSYGHELSTKADIGAATSTNWITASSGVVIYGTVTSGTYNSTDVRDDAYWKISENAVNGLTVEMTFNLLNDNDRPGVFNVFGRYAGVPSATHNIDLWAYNYEALSWEKLVDQFLPGGSVADNTYSHEYYERNINRFNNNEVKFRLIHHVLPSYNASHYMYLDYVGVSSISLITASDVADAVWDELLSQHQINGSAGHGLATASGIQQVDIDEASIADAVWNESVSEHTISGSFGKLMSDIDISVDAITLKLPARDIAESGEYDTILNNIESYVLRGLGLSQENYYLDNTYYTTYSGIKLLTSGRLRTYSNSGSVGTSSNVLATYQITSTWTADALSTYKVVRS